MTDKDLAIIIDCEPNFSHNWMSFVSFYSIYKNLSDAQVFLRVSCVKEYFFWANILKVKVFRNQFKIERPIIKIIKPSVMAVRQISDNLDIVSSKSNISGCFVDYRYGCGSFELDKWINTKKVPFDNAIKRFSTTDLTINEYAVLNIWEQSCSLYKQVGGLS